MNDRLLDIKYFHELTNAVSLPRNSDLNSLEPMYLTENTKFILSLPITNYGGFSMEWYSLVAFHLDVAGALLGYLQSLDNVSGQWMYLALKSSMNASNPDSFDRDFSAVCDVLELLIVKERGL